MTDEEALRLYKDCKLCRAYFACDNKSPCFIAHEMAAAALRERIERKNPQPLTLNELREMGGEPVYIQRIPYNFGEWHICHGERKYKRHGQAVISMGNGWLEIEEDYGKTWLAYRYKKEADK